MTSRVLCPLSEVAEPGGRGFTVDLGAGPVDIFVVRAGGHLRGYVNVCPHAGTPLDWRPHQFLSPDRKAIQCATHGAQFDIATGECIRGPCRGAYLRSVSIVARDGEIVVETTT